MKNRDYKSFLTAVQTRKEYLDEFKLFAILIVSIAMIIGIVYTVRPQPTLPQHFAEYWSECSMPAYIDERNAAETLDI